MRGTGWPWPEPGYSYPSEKRLIGFRYTSKSEIIFKTWLIENWNNLPSADKVCCAPSSGEDQLDHDLVPTRSSQLWKYFIIVYISVNLVFSVSTWYHALIIFCLVAAFFRFYSSILAVIQILLHIHELKTLSTELGLGNRKMNFTVQHYCYLHCIVCHTWAAGCVVLPDNVTCCYRK